jgi:hypothetical protein
MSLTHKVQVSSFKAPRNPIYHEKISRSLIASVLLGNIDPWTHPEFEAFRDGFDIRLKNGSFLEVRELKTFDSSPDSSPTAYADIEAFGYQLSSASSGCDE